GPRRAGDDQVPQLTVPGQGYRDRRALLRGGRALRGDGGGGCDLPRERRDARRGVGGSRRAAPRRNGPRGRLRGERDVRGAASRHGESRWL
ncbi:MAG: Metal-dependent hydrolase YbeY, involved in rRNA and/or ribosome maturation and assembly, partial [uncultured Rubrobacteraceae bacterium]